MIWGKSGGSTIATTIIWAAALFVIILIMTIYMGATLFLKEKNGDVGKNLIVEEGILKEDSVLTKNLVGLITSGGEVDAELLKRICKEYYYNDPKKGELITNVANQQYVNQYPRTSIDLLFIEGKERKAVTLITAGYCDYKMPGEKT